MKMSSLEEVYRLVHPLKMTIKQKGKEDMRLYFETLSQAKLFDDFIKTLVKNVKEKELGKVPQKILDKLEDELDRLAEDLHDHFTKELKRSGIAREVQPIIWGWYEKHVKQQLKGLIVEQEGEKQ